MSFLSENGWNREFAAFLASLINELEGPDPRTVIYEMLFRKLRIGCQVAYFPLANLVPAHAIIRTQGEMVIIIDGCRSTAQFAAAADGYRATFFNNSDVRHNPFFDTCATAIVADVTGMGLARVTSLRIAGFSLGGAVAHLMLARTSIRVVSSNQVQAISFGSPRAATYPEIDFMKVGGDHVRWFHAADAIPLMPPRCSDCLGLALASGKIGRAHV